MPKDQKTGQTAGEYLAEMAKDPEWVARHAAQDAKQRELEARYRAEEELMVADLRRAGYRVGSVYDLVNTAQSYPDAIPVLLNHIKRPYSDRIKEGIARALTVREARGIAGPGIIATLRHSQDNDRVCRWALANALTIVADRADRDAIKGLIEVEADADVSDRLKRALKTAVKP